LKQPNYKDFVKIYGIVKNYGLRFRDIYKTIRKLNGLRIMCEVASQQCFDNFSINLFKTLFVNY
jgi:hypothetical protein